MIRVYVPLAAFIIIVIFFAAGLTRDPKIIPSPLIDKPAPAFVLPELFQQEKLFSNNSLSGKVTLINVWASWCGTCVKEHSLLLDLVQDVEAAGSGLQVIGLNYKDDRAAAIKWLERLGNPYTAILFDPDGSCGLDWGVYGVPETFVIDQYGIVRYKLTGPLTQAIISGEILPLVQRLQES